MSWVGTAQSKREGQPLPWYWQLIAALLLVAAVICLVDVLAIAVRSAVESRDQSWPWGSREQSSGQPAATPTTFRMASVHLVVSVNGDQLVARYTVKSSSQEALTSQVLSAESAGSSTTMVNDLLGQISIAQFRDGITGNQLAWGTLSFGAPQLQVTGDNTTVTISSNPFRLLLAQQYIEVYQPAEQTDTPSRDVEFADPSEVQVLHITGARLTSAANGDTDLQPGNSAVEADAARARGKLDDRLAVHRRRQPPGRQRPTAAPGQPGRLRGPAVESQQGPPVSPPATPRRAVRRGGEQERGRCDRRCAHRAVRSRTGLPGDVLDPAPLTGGPVAGWPHGARGGRGRGAVAGGVLPR